MERIVISNPFIVVFIVGTVLTFCINQFLEWLDFRARVKNGGKVPSVLQDVPGAEVFDSEKLKNICAYENSKYFSWIPSSIINVALTLFLVISGFYPWLFFKICRITGFPNGFVSTYACAMLFFVIASIPSFILNIPFSLIDEFIVEKKHGFSKMTVSLWILDTIKSLVLGLVISAVLLAAIIGVLTIFPHSWWIFVTVIIFAFSLVMMVLYPLVIAPIFNKFTPLEEGSLKSRITELMESLGFKANGIFIMDASKRSGHSNAYFGGIGKSKRIVLYDTLLDQLTEDELLAVLGHELGHYKLHHIIRKFIVIVPLEFALTYLLYLFASKTNMYTGFGFAFASQPLESVQFIGFFLANILFGAWTEILNPITSFSSRKDEFAADAFSARLTKNPEALMSALVKLNSENLSELLPPKLYVIWNYDHPTLVERVEALKKIKETM